MMSVVSVSKILAEARLALSSVNKGTTTGGDFTRTIRKYFHTEQKCSPLDQPRKSFPGRHAFSSQLCVRRRTPLKMHHVRTRVSMVMDTSVTRISRPSSNQAQILSNVRETQPMIGHRFASSNAGMSSKVNWVQYLGATLLLITGSAGAWVGYRVYQLRKRGVVPFYIPKLSLKLFGPWGTYKGVTITSVQLNSIERAKDFAVRPDDVYVATFPRSGTTWTQEIIYLICNRADEQKAKSGNLEERFPYLDDPAANFDALDKRESPRFIKTHLPYHMLPSDFNKKKPKLIYVMRNPKDVTVSNYHLWRSFQNGYSGSFSDYFELFMQDKLQFAPWFNHVKGYWERRHEDNILIIKYEDLIANFPREVERLSKFLDKPLSAEEMTTIVRHCSFGNMKQNDMVNYKWLDDRGFTKDIGTTFMRKGKVGDWKNHFTPEMDKRMMAKIGRPLEEIGLEIKYEVDLKESKQS